MTGGFSPERCGYLKERPAGVDREEATRGGGETEETLEISGSGGGSLAMELVSGALASRQAKAEAEAGVALLKKGLDLQREQAALLLQTMGIGQALDVSG